jgi:hypothetical protein
MGETSDTRTDPTDSGSSVVVTGAASGRAVSTEPSSAAEARPLPPPSLRPKVVVVADLLPALSVLSTVSLTGLPLAWLWSRLAPPTRIRVTEEGALVALRTESYHRFDGIAIFLLLTFAVGVLIGAVVWTIRRRRGPVVLVAAVLGSMIAAWLTATTGLSLAAELFPPPDQFAAGTLFNRAPVLDVPWLPLLAPMGTAFAYGVATAWNGAEDLGRRR